jgi:hypothetical protein
MGITAAVMAEYPYRRHAGNSAPSHFFLTERSSNSFLHRETECA